MAFRSSEYLQRNELVRYQLDDVIRSPGNNQHQVKNGYKFTINDRSRVFTIGITLFSKFSFSFKNWQMEMDMLMQTVSL